jgi:hypothetical protein
MPLSCNVNVIRKVTSTLATRRLGADLGDEKIARRMDPVVSTVQMRRSMSSKQSREVLSLRSRLAYWRAAEGLPPSIFSIA